MARPLKHILEKVPVKGFQMFGIKVPARAVAVVDFGLSSSDVAGLKPFEVVTFEVRDRRR